MKNRFIICHMDPNNYGSHITWRSTLEQAKAVADAHVSEGKIGVWDNNANKYVYTAPIGARYTFKYPDYGTPDTHPDYTAHSGQVVTVIRQLTDKECDPECQPSYRVKANDGWEGTAHVSELVPLKGAAK